MPTSWAELFAEEEARLSGKIQVIRRDQGERQVEPSRLSDLAARFDEMAGILREMDVERLSAAATDLERSRPRRGAAGVRRHVPNHVKVMVSGARRLNVTLQEVGLTGGMAVLWCRRGDLNPHGP